MNKTFVMTAVAVLSTVGTALGADAAAKFDATEEKAVLTVVEKAGSQLGAAPFKGKGVLLLPVWGDVDAFCEDRLQGALIKAGVKTVLPKDIENPRFRSILLKIADDERDWAGIAAQDGKTLDELGHMHSANVFLEAKLSIDRVGKRRRVAKLGLLAYDVSTKRYVWQCYVTSESGEPVAGAIVDGKIDPNIVPKNQAMNVVVTVFRADDGSAALADRIGSAARSELAKLGYTVDGAGETNVELSVTVTRTSFDKLGEYNVFDGTARLTARLVGSDERTLAETTVEEHGTRGLGVAAAERKLADKMIPNVNAWLAKSLNTDALGLASECFTLNFAEQKDVVGDISVSELFRRAIAGLKGVRSVSVIANDPNKGAATFRAIYDKKTIRNSIVNVLFLEHPELGNKLAD